MFYRVGSVDENIWAFKHFNVSWVDLDSGRLKEASVRVDYETLHSPFTVLILSYAFVFASIVVGKIVDFNFGGGRRSLELPDAVGATGCLDVNGGHWNAACHTFEHKLCARSHVAYTLIWTVYKRRLLSYQNSKTAINLIELQN